MKKVLLILFFLTLTVFLPAQTIQLPGIGSNVVSVNSSNISATTQLVFGNPEYQVIGFSVSFLTNTNANYTSASPNNYFTADMLNYIPQLATGNDISLQVTLQAPGEGHEPWVKNYTIQIN